MTKSRPKFTKMIPQYAFSFPDFCESHDMSRTQLYNLIKKGEGPKIMKVGKRRLISIEAAEEWRKKLTDQSI